jgi:hypothetical protein
MTKDKGLEIRRKITLSTDGSTTNKFCELVLTERLDSVSYVSWATNKRIKINYKKYMGVSLPFCSHSVWQRISYTICQLWISY